jgi:hypothetical protein
MLHYVGCSDAFRQRSSGCEYYTAPSADHTAVLERHTMIPRSLLEDALFSATHRVLRAAFMTIHVEWTNLHSMHWCMLAGHGNK